MYKWCEECRLHLKCKSPVSMGRGNINPKLIIVVDSLEIEDDVTETTMSGRVGSFLDKVLGDNLQDVYITSLVKCVTYSDVIKQEGIRPPTDEEAGHCKNILSKELAIFDESVPVMSMGNFALNSLVGENEGIGKEFGRKRNVTSGNKTFSLVPNYSPNYILKSPHMLHKFRSLVKSIFTGDFVEIRDDLPKTKILDVEESLKYLDDTLRLYKEGTIQWTVYDSETTDLSPWKGDILMVSFSHPAVEEGVSIPLVINNTIDPFYLEQYEGMLKDKMELLGLTSVSEEIEVTEYEAKCKKVKEEVSDFLIEKTRIKWEITAQQVAKTNLKLKEVIETIPLVGHNLKFDLKFLLVKNLLDISKVRIFGDTLIMAHQLYGRSPGMTLKLKDLCRKLFNVEEDWDRGLDRYLNKYRLVKDKHFGNIPTGVLGEYAGLDAYYNKKLFIYLNEQITDSGGFILDTITKAIVPYTDAECKGVSIDHGMYEYLSVGFTQYVENVFKLVINLPIVNSFFTRYYYAASETNSKRRVPWPNDKVKLSCFSLTSVAQLKDILYSKEGYNLPIQKHLLTPKGEPKTGAEALEWFMENGAKGEAREFLDLLQKYKDVNTIKTRYIDGMPMSLVDGMFKTDFNLTGTVTGRMSSNFHGLPSRSDIKRVFNSRWNSIGGLFLCADQSQLEVRIGATLSKEMKLVDAYKTGIDVHAATGSRIYKIPIEEVTKKQRDVGKTVNFATFYGKSAHTLAPDLGVSYEEAQAILDGFFAGHDTLSAWIKSQQKFVRTNGFITTPMGRKIEIPEAFSSNPALRSHADRTCVNYPVQGTASDCVTISGNEIYYKNKEEGLKSVFLGSVHDSQEIDIYPGELFKVLMRVKEENEIKLQERFSWLICPLQMDISLGDSWGGSIEFEIKELSEEIAVLKGKALRKDFLRLKMVAERAYDVDLEAHSVKSIDSFPIDILFKDSEQWEATITIRSKKDK